VQKLLANTIISTETLFGFANAKTQNFIEQKSKPHQRLAFRIYCLLLDFPYQKLRCNLNAAKQRGVTEKPY
jgi:hypothetical protein